MPTTAYLETSADTLIGTVDGVTATFTITRDPRYGSAFTVNNGLRVAGTVSPSNPRSFVFAVAPAVGDVPGVSYESYASDVGSYAANVGIANLALIAINANTLTTINDLTPSGEKVRAIWDYTRDEVLEAADWQFAITRAALTRNGIAPLYGYDYAYDLPSDYLRLVARKDSSFPGIVGDYDPPVFPGSFPYRIETLPAGTKVLLTDYDDTDDDLIINYVRRVTDPAVFTATFISAFSYRLAERLAIAITEDKQKAQMMNALYRGYLLSAKEVNQSSDYFADSGSHSWDMAGRE